MDRAKFMEAFNRAPDELDKRRLRRLAKNSIAATDETGLHNLIIVMEELNELAQQTSKMLRGIGDRTALIEEMADVLLGFIYLEEICDVTTPEIYKAMNVKLDRLEKVLREKGVYL